MGYDSVEMACEIQSNSGRGQTAPLEIPVIGSPGRALHESLNFLREKWHEPITVGDLTKVSALSRRGFQKAFQRHTGHSPGRELRRVRIERSKELLASGDDNLRVVAQRCGYRSVNSFWVAFRQATGMSPGKYRSRFQRA
jgi:AraC family transcriptional regulator, transcriptional activator FtrA